MPMTAELPLLPPTRRDMGQTTGIRDGFEFVRGGGGVPGNLHSKETRGMGGDLLDTCLAPIGTF